jgi:hypothetical protein
VSSHTFRWYAEQHPAGAIARLLWEGALRTTTTGKPRSSTPYWQLAAEAGRSVVAIGADCPALPGQRGFQRLIRTLDDGATLGSRELAAMVTAWRHGVRPRTLTTLGELRLHSTVFTFDERNRLTSSVDSSTSDVYTWTPRGTLSSVTHDSDPTIDVDYDALVSMASGFCPVAVSGSARWWPSELPSDGHWFCPGSVGQWLHPLAGGGLCEPDGVAGGHHEVGVV